MDAGAVCGVQLKSRDVKQREPQQVHVKGSLECGLGCEGGSRKPEAGVKGKVLDSIAAAS